MKKKRLQETCNMNGKNPTRNVSSLMTGWRAHWNESKMDMQKM